MFFKKVDHKETKTEKSTLLSETKQESEKRDNVQTKFTEEKLPCKMDKKLKQNSDTENTKVPIIKTLDTEDDKEKLKETVVDSEGGKDSKKNSQESDNFSNSEDSIDKSELNPASNMDVDSDINLLSDDDEDNDNDHNKSDTDSKKTEHEETDSRDDTNRNPEVTLSTPKRSKLLSTIGKEKKLTPKQMERKLEIQKKKESRAKQRLVIFSFLFLMYLEMINILLVIIILGKRKEIARRERK